RLLLAGLPGRRPGHSLRPARGVLLAAADRPQRARRRADAHPPRRPGRPVGGAAPDRRDLHDGAQARLVALTMHLGRAEARLEDRPETAELIRQAREEATAAVAELRDLARGIAPPVLADRGLVAAVEALAQRSGIDTTVESKLTQRLAP